jgi:hypothetical protein
MRVTELETDGREEARGGSGRCHQGYGVDVLPPPTHPALRTSHVPVSSHMLSHPHPIYCMSVLGTRSVGSRDIGYEYLGPDT